MAKEYYRDRIYPTKHIKNLPKEFSFNKGTKTLMIDYATTDQLDVYKKLINDSANRGDNVGVDEYNEGDIKTVSLFDYSEIFQAIDPDSGQIEAAMFIQYSLFRRSYDPCSASVNVFRTNDIDNATYAELASLMGEFARALDIGYTQIYVEVAFFLSDLYLELRNQGFVTVAVFPDWVDIAGIGLTDNAVMVKQLNVQERKKRSKEEILKAVNSIYTPEKLQSTYFTTGCLQVPILPITATERSGMKFTFRNARTDEDKILYKMFSDAANAVEGYSTDEFPTLDSFRMILLTNNAVVMIEEESTKSLAGALLFIKALECRRASGIISDPSAILKNEYRGSGLTLLARAVMILVQKSIGFKMELGTTFSTNKAIIKLWKQFNMHNCGLFPKASYQRGYGWVDVVYSVKDLDEVGLLSKLGLELKTNSITGRTLESKL